MKTFHFIASSFGIISSVITVYLFLVGLADIHLLPKIFQSGKLTAALLLFLFFYLSLCLIHLACMFMRDLWVKSLQRQIGNPQLEILFHIFVFVAVIWVPVIFIWVELAVELKALHEKHSFFYDGDGRSFTGWFLFISVCVVYIVVLISEGLLINQKSLDILDNSDSNEIVK